MACSIQITEVSGQELAPGQGITILTIKGIATDCDRSEVCVSVHQTQPVDHTTPQKTAAVENGNWSVAFTEAEGDFPLGTFLCGSGNKYSVNAFCCADPDCVAPQLDGGISIPCGCPTIQIHLPTLRASDPCNPDVTRTVELSATVTPGAVTPVAVSFEVQTEGEDAIIYGPAGLVSTSGQVPSAEPWPVDLEPGSYIVRVNILNPTNCPPVEARLDVPQCQNIQQCPGIAWSASIPVECNQDDIRDVRVTASITAAANVSYSAQLRDPQGNIVASGNSESGILNLVSPAQQLLPGDYVYEVVFTSIPEGCDDRDSNTFTIPSCPGAEEEPCPEVSDIDVQISRNCEDGRRGVRVSTTVTGLASQSLGAELVLTEPDGTERVVESHDNPSSQSFSYQEDLPPGDYTITLRTTTPTNCGTHAKDFTVTPCDDRPRTPDVVIDLCFLLSLFALLGLGFTVLGLVLLLCPVFSWFPPDITVIIGGIMAGVGALVMTLFFILWIVICKPQPCDWLLLSWKATILIGAVFTYAVFCPGCIYLGFGGLGILAGLGLFIWWVFGCKPTLCRTYTEWLIFILFVLDVVSVVEIALGGCVLTTDWWYALVWLGTLIVLKFLMVAGLRRNQCQIGF